MERFIGETVGISECTDSVYYDLFQYYDKQISA